MKLNSALATVYNLPLPSRELAQPEEAPMQSSALPEIQTHIFAALDGRRPESALRELSKGFAKAAGFENLSSERLQLHVCALIEATVRIARQVPGVEVEHQIAFMALYADPRHAFMLQPQILDRSVKWLVAQGDPVAVHFAMNLVGKLARMNPEAENLPRLVELVLVAATPFAHDKESLLHSIKCLSVVAAPHIGKYVANRLAHMCLDRLEHTSTTAPVQLCSRTIVQLTKLLELEGGRLLPDSGVLERMGRLFVSMAVRLEFASDPSGFLVRCLELKELPPTYKRKAALALISHFPSTEIPSRFPTALPFAETAAQEHRVLCKVVAHLPEDMALEWAEALLSTPCDTDELLDLAPLVTGAPAGAVRDRLLGVICATTERLLADPPKDTWVPDIVRLALLVGAGAKDQMAAQLLEATQDLDSAVQSFDEQEASNLLDQVAVLSFHLHPDVPLDAPALEESEANDTPAAGVPVNTAQFAYPSWLAARRLVLYEAQPAIAAGRATPFIMHSTNMPNVIATLTDAYMGRMVVPADWPLLANALTAAQRLASTSE